MKINTSQIRGSLDLLEEAVHLLRQAPLGLLLRYFLGTFPFLLGFLYFWADMSRGPFAYRYVPEAAFGISLLYVWMKCWQSVFCSSVYSHLMGRPAEKYSAGRILRLVATQLILQPYSLFVQPASLLILLPFGWTFAFFQNLLIVGDGKDLDLRKVMRTSWRLASLWPAQNHRLLFILLIFSLIVFLNIGIALLMIPELMSMLFGIETVFTLSGMKMLNTTFLSVVAAFTYLCIDPLIAVVYTLRCFYGESVETGADLIAELKSLPKAS
ncbi:hypothetical protein L0222_03705 [bacterium]|nr:hypothetical protein [bacterium]MCI0602632.1 hypothetical protein [bacterium]